MKVLIIEDELPATQKLERLLKEIDETIEIVGVLESVEDSTNWFLQNSHPDLIFMDIQLNDGLSFEIFENIEIKSPVIFTTAFDEYALRAFKVNSVDYLLKPLDSNALKKAVQKYRLVYKKDEYYSKIESLLNQLQPKTKERILIKIGEHYKSIQISDINYFFIKERCTFINIGKGKDYVIDYSLDKAEKMIDPKKFFRVNRNFIINYSSIKDIVAYSSNRLKIIIDTWPDNDLILVSRERVADFKIWMDR
jgi:DNA-binding LytR/AlgR family response regulator